MTPYEYVLEELRNVRRLLSDTLRHDYGPGNGGPYFEECHLRLTHIDRLLSTADPSNHQEVCSIYTELNSVARRIALIERAHLGEYSWPFSNEIQRIAEALLYDQTLTSRSPPIVHVIAESYGYRILNEGSFKHSPGRRRIAVVEFPRTLKHQVLFHPLLGHEICHTGFSVPAFIKKLRRDVIAPIISNSSLQDINSATAWINDRTAPAEIKSEISVYNTHIGPYQFTAQHRSNWITEIVCDIFGLILFGPAFLAAHNALLRALSQGEFDVDLIEQSHPPYAIRNKALLQCMRVMNWDTPSTKPSQGQYYASEKSLLDGLCLDNYPAWATLFRDDRLKQGLDNLQAMLLADGIAGYQKVGGLPLQQLLQRLSRKQPPIIDTIDCNGVPDLIPLDVGSIIYAGWVFAENGAALNGGTTPNFFDTNRLCEHALLQREAVVISKRP